jgi:hypothetical protein
MWTWGTLMQCMHGSAQTLRAPLGATGPGRWSLLPSVHRLCPAHSISQAVCQRRHTSRSRRVLHVVTAGRGSAALRELEEGRAERRSLELESKRPVGTQLCFQGFSNL